MTNKFEYTTQIVVIIAILALLLGLMLGLIFNLIECNDDSDDDHRVIYDSAYGHKVISGPVLLSEVEYSTSHNNNPHHPAPIPNPWSIKPSVMID